jgi:hypothetical protein
MTFPWLTDPVTKQKSVTLTGGVAALALELGLRLYCAIKNLPYDSSAALAILGVTWGAYVARWALPPGKPTVPPEAP